MSFDDVMGHSLASGTYTIDGKPMMLSGASDGADTLFGRYALAAGHDVRHILGPRNQPSVECDKKQSSTVVRVSDDVLGGDVASAAFEYAAAARHVGEPGGGTLDEWRESRRNFLQVRSASALAVVAYRLPPGALTPAMDIGGGTGLACQMYIDRFEPRGPEPASECELYLYDDGAPGWDGCLKDPATHRRWNRWQPVLDGASAPGRWVTCQPPSRVLIDAGRPYAGIGATRLSTYGEGAIRELYEAWREAPLRPAARVLALVGKLSRMAKRFAPRTQSEPTGNVRSSIAPAKVLRAASSRNLTASAGGGDAHRARTGPARRVSLADARVAMIGALQEGGSSLEDARDLVQSIGAQLISKAGPESHHEGADAEARKSGGAGPTRGEWVEWSEVVSVLEQNLPAARGTAKWAGGGAGRRASAPPSLPSSPSSPGKGKKATFDKSVQSL